MLNLACRFVASRGYPPHFNRGFFCRVEMASCSIGGKTMATPVTNIGFKNLIETFIVDVQKAERKALDVALISPINTATVKFEKVRNVAIRVELRNGCVGWGEVPILPPITAEDQPLAMAKVSETCQFLKSSPAMTLGSLLHEIGRILHGHAYASVSCIKSSS